MDRFKEQPKFEIQPAIEQKPFENPAVQSFFTEWCEINDSIEPQIISRDDWEQKSVKNVLEKTPDGKQALYIPEDLQLWEMIGIMEAVDKETFVAKPERQDEARKKILELGKTFQDAGVYIAQRLDSIDQGQEIASALAEEFYDYGQSLVSGKKPIVSALSDFISQETLTASETEAVDRFLAGENLYKSRQERVEKYLQQNPEQTAGAGFKKDELYEYETERRKTLAQFFRASAKAFELKGKNETNELRKNNIHLKPWQNNAPFHNAFIAKIEKAMKQKIETPKRELEGSIFRRGMELLQRNMPFNELPEEIKNSILHWQNGETTLREALQIDKLKNELEAVRQSGDIAKISAKEHEIADKIQKAVSGFPFRPDANNPSEMVATQDINCVGASTLGGALMDEVKLNYLVGNVPEHSILFLITSDGNIEWHDMLSAKFNENLTDEMIVGNKKDGSPITIASIVEFSKNPTPEGLMFDIKSEKYKDKLQWIKEEQRQFVILFEPEYGQQIQILNNTGNVLFGVGFNKEAVEAYQQAIALDPKFVYPYNGLGVAFTSLGYNQEAIKAFQQATTIDPKYTASYYGLGNAFRSSGLNKEAFESYQQAISINPKFAAPHFGLGNIFLSLGLNKEAIKEYQKFIDLADEQREYYWIQQARLTIKKLSDSLQDRAT